MESLFFHCGLIDILISQGSQGLDVVSLIVNNPLQGYPCPPILHHIYQLEIELERLVLLQNGTLKRLGRLVRRRQSCYLRRFWYRHDDVSFITQFRVDPLEPAKQGEKVNQFVPRNTVEDLRYFLRACLHCGPTIERKRLLLSVYGSLD